MNRLARFVFLSGTRAAVLSRSLRRCASTVFPLPLVLLLSGCAIVQHKVDLRKVPIASIEASQAPQANDPGIAPGEKSPLVVTITQPNGKKLNSEGKGKGPVRWRDLTVTSSMGAVNNKGVLSLPADPRVSEGKPPHVTVDVPSHPDLHAQLDIPLRYDRNFSATFSGASGTSGFNGTDGLSGSNGSPGSLDPDHPSPGGDGGNGMNGSDGTDGTNGSDGPRVRVLLALHYSDQRPDPLLQVSVTSGKTEKLFLVDPHGGSLTVTSAGGRGGSGGRGGRGGRGGSGGIGSPNGRDGSNGLDGRDGFSGSDGSGGPIFMTYDPRVKPYLSAIELRSPGGPQPVVMEAPVGPLW